MDQEILSQLLQIKWLVALFVGVVVVRLVILVWWEFRKSGGVDTLLSSYAGFSHRVRTLLEQGHNREAMALAQERCRQYPGDALAFWYHATAAYRVGELSEAIASLRKAEELQPDWGATHVRPFIEAIESQGVPAKAELYVVSPGSPVGPASTPAPEK